MTGLEPCVPNCSFVMYEGDGGVTFLGELRSLAFPRANMGFLSAILDGSVGSATWVVMFVVE